MRTQSQEKQGRVSPGHTELKWKRVEIHQIENFKSISLQQPGDHNYNIIEKLQSSHIDSPERDRALKKTLVLIGKNPLKPLRPKQPPKPRTLSIQGIKDSSDRTPQETYLLKKLKRSKQISKELRKDANMIRTLKSPALKNLVEAVASNQKRKECGVRWPESVKSIAVNIYKKSPSAYRYISEVFNMPSVTTVKQICYAEAASSGTSSFSKPDAASSEKPLKIGSKKENSLSELLFHRITRITQDTGAASSATRKPLNMKILIKGAKNVGKSCLLQRLQGGPFIEKYFPSEETQVAPVQWTHRLKGRYVKVDAWDVVDKEGFENETAQSATEDATEDHHGWKASSLDVYQKANAVILMMDITNPQTYEYVEQEISRVPPELPVLILGNHCDLPHLRRVHPHHIERLLQQARLDRTAPVLYTESSMRNGFGLRLLHKFLDVPLLRVQCASLLEQLQRCQRDAEHLEHEIALLQRSEEGNYDTFVKRLKTGKRPHAPARTANMTTPSVPPAATLSSPLKPKATKRKAETVPTKSKPEYIDPMTRSPVMPEPAVRVEKIPSSQEQQHNAHGRGDFYESALNSSFLDDLPVAANQELAYPNYSEDNERKDFEDPMNRVLSTHSNILPVHRNLNEDQNMALKTGKTLGTGKPSTKRRDEEDNRGLTPTLQQSSLSMPALDSDFPIWAGPSKTGRPPEDVEDPDIAKKVIKRHGPHGGSDKLKRKQLKS